MRKIGKRALKLSEAMQEWTEGLDGAVAHLSHKVNGPLMTELAEATGFSDKSCVKTFTKGTPILKKIPGSADSVLRQYPKAKVYQTIENSAKNETRHYSRH